MKSSNFVEEFEAEFNIPLSIGLWFLEEKDVSLVEVSPIKGELSCRTATSKRDSEVTHISTIYLG